MSYAESGNLREKYDVVPVTAEAARLTRVGNISDQLDDAPAAAPMFAVRGPLTAAPSTLKRPATYAEPHVETASEKIVRVSTAFANAMSAKDAATTEVLRLREAIGAALDKEKAALELTEATRRALADLVATPSPLDSRLGDTHHDTTKVS